VRLPGSSEPAKRRTNDSRVDVNEIAVGPKEGEAEEGDWIPIHGSPTPPHPVVSASNVPSRYLSEHIAQVSFANQIVKERGHKVSAALYHSPSAPGPAPAAIVHIRTLEGNYSEALSRRRARLQAILRRLGASSKMGEQKTELHLLYRKHCLVYFDNI
jgi:hypothetical protein